MTIPDVDVAVSGERFRVLYRLTGREDEALEKAREICFEQTVEFPEELTPPGDIRERIVGCIEALEAQDANHFHVVISYAVETVGADLPQLLNVVFGNSSIKPGIRVERLELPDTFLRHFNGPRFGREGLRAWLKVPLRPLLCTALKPMGLPPAELAGLAYQFARGGIDIIKDDHGLADQPFAGFRDRVERCAEAVARANRETGFNCIYVPNITAPIDGLISNAQFAKSSGAGGLLVAPGLIGFDAMRQLADAGRLALPIMSHPALQGSFVVSSESGISHYALFGQIARLAGADATIYPNYGGRFSFSREECASIVAGTVVSMGHLRPIFPAPGGGMSLARVPEMLELYGRDVIFLIGGGLHNRRRGLVANCINFRELVEKM